MLGEVAVVTRLAVLGDAVDSFGKWRSGQVRVRYWPAITGNGRQTYSFVYPFDPGKDDDSAYTVEPPQGDLNMVYLTSLDEANDRGEVYHLLVTRLAKAAAVAGIPNLDDQLLTAHYVVDAVGRQLAMRMINVTNPEGKKRGFDMGCTGDFRGTGVGTEALAALTRLGYDDHWGKPITVHMVLDEVYENVCHERAAQAQREVVQAPVGKVQRDRELAEERSQREAVDMIAQGTISDISANRTPAEPPVSKCEPEPEPAHGPARGP